HPHLPQFKHRRIITMTDGDTGLGVHGQKRDQLADEINLRGHDGPGLGPLPSARCNVATASSSDSCAKSAYAWPTDRNSDGEEITTTVSANCSSSKATTASIGATGVAKTTRAAPEWRA